DNFTQVVDVVEEHAFKLVHCRVDVTGHGDIDQEHGTVAAFAHRRAHLLARQDKVRRTARSQHDIDFRHGVFEVFVVEHPAAALFGHGLGALARAVGHQDFGNARAAKMTRGAFGHFPGAYHQDLLALELAENFAGELHRGIAHGDGAL